MRVAPERRTLPPCPQPQECSLPLLQVACAAGWANTWQARVTDWPRTTVSSESSLRNDGAGEQREGEPSEATLGLSARPDPHCGDTGDEPHPQLARLRHQCLLQEGFQDFWLLTAGAPESLCVHLSSCGCEPPLATCIGLDRVPLPHSKVPWAVGGASPLGTVPTSVLALQA